MAIDYPRNQYTNKKPVYGIKILHYDSILGKFVYHSRIESSILQNFGSKNVIKLNYNGMKLIVKPVMSKIDNRIIFSRNSLNDQFVLVETLGKLVESSYTYGRAPALDASKKFEVIVSGDGDRSIVVYYCLSDIPNATILY